MLLLLFVLASAGRAGGSGFDFLAGGGVEAELLLFWFMEF